MEISVFTSPSRSNRSWRLGDLASLLTSGVISRRCLTLVVVQRHFHSAATLECDAADTGYNMKQQPAFCERPDALI